MNNMFVENYSTDVSAFLESRKSLKGREREMKKTQKEVQV